MRLTDPDLAACGYFVSQIKSLMRPYRRFPAWRALDPAKPEKGAGRVRGALRPPPGDGLVAIGGRFFGGEERSAAGGQNGPVDRFERRLPRFAR
jgi:hypothetical protein